MESVKLILAVCCGVCVLHGLFLAIYLVSAPKLRSVSNYLLAGLLIALALRIAKSIFYYLVIDIPFFTIHLGLMGKLAIGPLTFFYICSLHNPDLKLKPHYAIHLVPSLIALGSIGQLGMRQLSLGYDIAALTMTAYIAGGWMIYFKNLSKKDAQNTLQWSRSLLIGILLIWSSFLMQIFSGSIEAYALGGVASCVVLYVLSFLAMRQFSVFKPNANKQKNGNGKQQLEIVSKLNELFDERKIFLEPEVTLSLVAQRMNMPTYLISKVINDRYGKKFPEFVNDYRIAEARLKLLDKAYQNENIENIAFECGFNTLSAFYTAFKKGTGVTPNEFRRRGQAMTSGT
ncbi:MAG: AraC family transcriptional regulator [Bacteroidota bacterium]